MRKSFLGRIKRLFLRSRVAKLEKEIFGGHPFRLRLLKNESLVDQVDAIEDKLRELARVMGYEIQPVYKEWEIVKASEASKTPDEDPF